MVIKINREIFNVNTDLLKWTRISVKYEKNIVAGKLNVNPEKITEWEESGKINS